jgi:hypothetical protein
MGVDVAALKGQRPVVLEPCAPRACASCPWWAELHGTPHPKRFYEPRSL